MEKTFILRYKNSLSSIGKWQSKPFISKIFMLLSLFILYGSMSVAQPFSVTVNTNAIPPVNPLISQYVSSGNVNSTLLYTNAFGGSIQVAVYGKIERLSPSPFTLSVNAVYLPQPPITLTAGVPLQLSATDRLNAFGFRYRYCTNRFKRCE
jgi:hypothetical protein